MPVPKRPSSPAALAALLACLLAALFAAPAQAQEQKRHVLFLNSYQNGYAWSDEILEGVRDALAHYAEPVDLQIEYMDTKRYRLEEIRDVLKPYYQQKYDGAHLDVIIAADNNAYDLLLETRGLLFRGVPVVFCGVNDFKPESIQRLRNITGVLEDPDMAATVEFALRLRPQFKRVVIIGDNSVTSAAITNQFRKTWPVFEGRLQYEYWDSYTLNEILERAAGLDSDTMIYFTPFYKGAHGELYSAEEVLQAIARHTTSMVFSSWRFLLGHGMVGGKVLSGQKMGRQAAEMAMRIMDGESASRIPVMPRIEEGWAFDWNVLQRFGIPEETLPEGSTVINKPDAFYRVEPRLLWIGLVFMVSLSVILVFLVLAIAQRRKVERKITAQLAFQEILMDTIPLLVCWKDTRQRYLGANKSFAQFFGLPGPEDIGGKSDADLAPGTLPLVQLAEWDREVIRTGLPLRGRGFTAMDRDGSHVWFEINKVPLRGLRGEVVGTLSTAEDVTRKVQLKQQLLQSQKMEAIGTLAGGIAHDFNNILTAIINSCELALMDLEDGSQTARDVNRALTAAQRGGRVVKQILAFSRPTLEGFASTDLAEVIAETVDLLRASLPRNIEIDTRIEPTGQVWANPNQIHQAIMNLCTNAFQALRDKGGRLRVTLGEEDVDEETSILLSIGPGRHLRLAVEDNGPGIPPEIADKIFDPFFTTKGTAEGTGLGLAVVHGIVKAHSGGIRMTSRPYRRTAFEIYLPCRTEQASVADAADAALVSGSERLLFVEDDPDQLETVPRLLADLGYRVTPAPDARQALRRIRDSAVPFDLVITDFDMPGMDGMAFTRRLEELDPALPVIMVSGRRNAAERATESPSIRRVVLKPYDRSTLAAAVRATLDDSPEH
jgi:PAS domain S-box-containing protein